MPAGEFPPRDALLYREVASIDPRRALFPASAAYPG